jgi:hypothetical protein
MSPEITHVASDGGTGRIAGPVIGGSTKPLSGVKCLRLIRDSRVVSRLRRHDPAAQPIQGILPMSD